MLTITSKTRSRPQIIGVIYLHIPMHSPVDRATVKHWIVNTSQRRDMILYSGTWLTLLAYFVSIQFLRPARPSIRCLQRNLVFHLFFPPNIYVYTFLEYVNSFVWCDSLVWSRKWTRVSAIVINNASITAINMIAEKPPECMEKHVAT